MAGAIRNFAGGAVWACDPDGSLISREADALDLIGESYGSGAAWIALPVARLAPDFLRLRTGLAGAVLQKLVTYGYRVAIVGDVGGAAAASDALRDFVRESNRGTQVWFVADEGELEARLAALP